LHPSTALLPEFVDVALLDHRAAIIDRDWASGYDNARPETPVSAMMPAMMPMMSMMPVRTGYSGWCAEPNYDAANKEDSYDHRQYFFHCPAPEIFIWAVRSWDNSSFSDLKYNNFFLRHWKFDPVTRFKASVVRTHLHLGSAHRVPLIPSAWDRFFLTSSDINDEMQHAASCTWGVIEIIAPNEAAWTIDTIPNVRPHHSKHGLNEHSTKTAIAPSAMQNLGGAYENDYR
jgi:hypothetical protein